MWLTEQSINHGWNNFKSFMGNAWHSGKQVLEGVDKWANLATRLLGAAAGSGLGGRALESGIQAADAYSRARNKALQFGSNVEATVDRFRQAAPELKL